MIPGARLVILGRQGAGKGTQCVRLSRHYVVPHVSTGDMLRAGVKEGTELGQKARAIMDDGGLVPDDVMIGIVADRLARDDSRTRGYILDGFPRTVGQAEALRQVTAEQPLHAVIDLDVAEEVVLRRIADRRVCTDCGTNYSVQSPPRYDWTCDVCGGEVRQRDDDTEEAVRTRLDLYRKQTAPLVEWYAERGLLEVVDGEGPTDDVTKRLVAAVDARRRRGFGAGR